MANEQTKPEWGEPGQPSEGGVLPDRQPSRSRDTGRSKGKNRGHAGDKAEK
jgi:hypothetical protein